MGGVKETSGVGDPEIRKTGEVSKTQEGQTGETGIVQTDKTGETSMEEESQGKKDSVDGAWSEQVEEAELEPTAKPKPAHKRRRKTRSLLNEAKSCKVGEDSGRKSVQDEESGNEDECVSDSSDVPGFKLSNSQERKMYSVEDVKIFLLQTKNQHGVKVEDYFPDLSVFYTSARLHMSQKEESGLTDQEVFRLKKLVLKVKKQLNNDVKNSNVCFN